MELEITVRTIQKGALGVVAKSAITAIKLAFKKKLKASAKKADGLRYYMDKVEGGFSVFITGDRDKVISEYDIMDKEYTTMADSKAFDKGLTTLSLAGFCFSYCLIEDGKRILREEA